jgi:hypothetical protein
MKANTINSEFDKASEFNRFGLISVVILLIGCMGGIAVGLGAINHLFSLILVIVPTMTTLSLLLAVSPMRWIFISATVSIIIDVLLIAYFTLF